MPGAGSMCCAKWSNWQRGCASRAPIIVQEIFEIVAHLNRDQQVSFLIAEQNINVALKYASRAYVLDTGRVVAAGSADDLLARGDLQDIYLGKR